MKKLIIVLSIMFITMFTNGCSREFYNEPDAIEIVDTLTTDTTDYCCELVIVKNGTQYNLTGARF